jgi:hypothetical protein
MKFVTYAELHSRYGIPYSSRQLKRLEAAGKFPKRIPLIEGGSLKGWPEVLIDEHLQKLVDVSRAGGKQNASSSTSRRRRR